MYRYRIVLSALIFILALSLIISPGLGAQVSQNVRLNNVHYLVGADLRDLTDFDISSLQLSLNFGISRINSFESIFYYDAENIDLQGIWLVNFTENIQPDMNLRLNIATIEGFNSVEPGLGLGAKFPAGEINYIFADLDYFFDMESPNFTYTLGLGIPLTVNSSLTFSAGRPIWNRDGHQINIGMEIEL